MYFFWAVGIPNVSPIDQSVNQKEGPNLEKIATEMKLYDLTPYTC